MINEYHEKKRQTEEAMKLNSGNLEDDDLGKF
jgi:hypothetical protein